MSMIVRSTKIKAPERHSHAIDALMPILRALEAYAAPRETCLACGCLCLVDERCPGCLSRQLQRAQEVSR